MSEINLGQVVGPRGFQGIQGIKGDKGDQGIQGVVGPKVDVAASLGTSTVYAVSQKLLTDEVDKMTTSIATIKSQSDASIVKVDNADTKIDTKTTELQTSIAAILGINKKLTNRINALEESNISSLFNNGASKGVWLDPSDLKTMFQNVGGASLPVTKDGDPVGLMLDKSQGLEGAVTNVAKPFIADYSDGDMEVTNTSEGTKLVCKNLSGSAFHIFEVGKTYKLSVVYSIPETANNISIYNTFRGVNDFLFTATKGVRNKAEVTLTAKSTAIYFRGSSGGEITIHEVVIKEIKGNHASQPLAASRPTYRTDGVLHWLEFDGVDDSLDVNVAATNNFDMSLSFNYKDKSAGATVQLRYNNGSNFIFASAINSNFNLFNTSNGKLVDTSRYSQGIKVITAYISNIESKYIGQSGEVFNLPTELSSTVNKLTIGGNTVFDVHGLIFKDSSQFYTDRSKQLHSYMQRKAGVEI